MRRLGVVGLSAALVLGLLSPRVALAVDPPANDLFANATTITATTQAATVDLSAATVEAGEQDCSAASTATQSIWYRIVAPTTGAVVARVSNATTTSYRLSTWRDTGGGLAGLSLVYCRNVGGAVATARVQAGTTYYVQIAGIGAGPGLISFTITFYPPPANDMFASAAPVGALPWTATVPQYAATTEAGEPNQCGLPIWSDKRTVWYTYFAAADGDLSVSTTVDNSAEARVVAFESGGTGWNGTTAGACGTGPSSTLSVRAGRTYRIQIVNFSGQGTLTVDFAFAAAPPPANDMFANATPITGTAFSAAVDTTRATGEPGEPLQCGGWAEGTVWFSYAAAETGYLTVSASAEGGLLAPYLDSGSGLSGLQALGCGTGAAGIAVEVQAGSRYYLQAGFIGPYGSPVPGAYTLLASFSPYAAPANDRRANATLVTSTPFEDSVDNRGATVESGEPHGCSVSLWRTVWYRITAPEDGMLTVAPASGTPTDSDLALYQAYGPGLSALAYLGCSYHDPLTYHLLAGATYFLQVYDAYLGGGTFHLRFTFNPDRDTTPPVAAIAGAAGSYAVDSRIAITGSATDLVDPAPALGCTLTGPAGTSVVDCAFAADAWALGLGRYTFTVTARDASGNQASADAPFDIVATYTSVSSLTRSWCSKASVANDLVAVLASAAAAEQRVNFKAEAGKLADFRAGVRAQSGKAFSADKGALLIAFSYGL